MVKEMVKEVIKVTKIIKEMIKEIPILSFFNKEERQEWLQEGIKLKDVFILLIISLEQFIEISLLSISTIFGFILAFCSLPIFFVLFLMYEGMKKIGNITIVKPRISK